MNTLVCERPEALNPDGTPGARQENRAAGAALYSPPALVSLGSATSLLRAEVNGPYLDYAGWRTRWTR